MVQRRSSSSPDSLPVFLTPLIGREQEIQDVSALIQRDDYRIVTVTGPGGVGKTRLAVAAALACSSFPDGIWFVDLAPITDPTLVVPTIAHVLGLRDDGPSSAAEWITAYLHGKQVLLVLDNLEQISDAALSLADLISNNPGLTMLVTSRVRLRISGERQYPLAPLNVPAQIDPSTPVEEIAAVQLFANRAQAVQPDFRIDGSNARYVLSICRHLDGLPLAIELAAARISMFNPANILDRLVRQLPLLTAGPQDLPERQQSIRNAIDWSYALLVPDDQILLRRLAVFLGGFSMGAAEVAASADPAIPDVLASLTRLLDSSLVRKIDSVTGDARFGMLETIREFGLDRLAESGETQRATDTLVHWATLFIEDATQGMSNWSLLPFWFARLDAELDNTRTAINWLASLEQYSEVLRLIGLLEEYWTRRPYHVEVLNWLDTAFVRADALDSKTWEQALYTAEFLAAYQGQPAKAMAYSEQGIRIGEELGNPLVMGRHLMVQGVAWEFSDDPTRSLELHAQSLPYFRQAGTPIFVASALTEIGDKLVQLGTVRDAIPYFEEALPLVIDEGDAWSISLTTGQWGFAELALGNPMAALKLFEESFESAIASEDPRIHLGAAAGFAGVALSVGDAHSAAKMLGTVESARIALGIVHPTFSLHISKLRSRVQASLGEDGFRKAADQGRAVPLDRAVSEMILKLHAREASNTSHHPTDPNALTPREIDVLHLLVEGKSDREIADALFIGPRTVQTHVSNLLAKLEVANRAEAAAVAIRKGLV